MKSIGICLLYKEFLPSWIKTGLINKIGEGNQITIFTSKLSNSIVVRELSHIDNLHIIQIELQRVGLTARANSFLSMMSKRRNVKSFRSRILRMTLGELRLFPRNCNMQQRVLAIFWNTKNLIIYICRYPYQLPAYLPMVNNILQRFFSYLDGKLGVSIDPAFNSNFDLIILPSGAAELETFQLIKGFNKLGMVTALCIENWDNLTSKTIITSKPSHILVMGPDSITMGASVQNISHNKFISAGVPRFNLLRNLIPSNSVVFNEKIRILYLGCFLPHNEVNTLNLLVQKLNKSTISNKYEVIYKQHPTRRPRFFEHKVLMSPIKLVKNSAEKVPEINKEHISIFNGIDIVISTPTSMVIEAMLLQKKIFLDLTNDGIHRTTTGLAYENYEHFDSLKKIENLVKCFDIDQLCKEIVDYCSKPMKKPVIYNLENLIEIQAPHYSDHILNIIS